MRSKAILLLVLALQAGSARAAQDLCLEDVLHTLRSIDTHGHALSIVDTDRVLPQDSSYKFSIDQDALRKAIHDLEVTTVKDMILWGIDSHYQGIQRIVRNGKDYLVISGLTKFPNPVPQLIIAKIAHRSAVSSKAATTLIGDAGGANIRIVRTVTIDSRYFHPGGIQFVGDLLLVGVQRHGRGPSEIVAFDFSDPEHPLQLPLRIDRPHKGASAVGGTRLPSGLYRGHYLIAVVGESYQGVDFYLSGGDAPTDFAYDPYEADHGIANPNGGFLELSTPEVIGRTGLFGGNDLSYQNISLVSQCDGKIFLLGTVSDRGITVDMSPLLSRGERLVVDLDHLIGEHPEARDVPVPNDNWLDAFHVDFSFLTPSMSERFAIQHVLRVKMFPSAFKYDYARRYQIGDILQTNLFSVNFDAAAGIFVHDTARVSLYCTKYFSTPRDAVNGYESIALDEFPATE